MAQPPTTNPPLQAVDRPASEPADAITERQSYWFYKHRYGDPSAMYVPVDASQTADHGHTIPARLSCDVVYVRSVWAVFRRVRKTWVAPAGSYCLILGHWTDGTLRLQLGLPDTQHPDRRVSIDGRFPGWIAEPTTERPSLPANFPRRRQRSALQPLMAVLLLAILASAYVTHGFGLQGLGGASGASPAATPTAAAPQPTATAQPVPPARSVVVANTDHQGVYVRHTPAMADRVRAYPDGTKLRLIGPDAQGEGLTWRHVAAPDGLEGYVPAQYVVDAP